MNDSEIKIVLVGGQQDDYEHYRERLADLNNGRSQLTWSKTYEEGLSYSLKDHPHVFIVNFRLDNRTAVEFIAEVRKNNCTKPIILLIDPSDFESRRAAKRAGAEFCLKKRHDDPEELADAILDSIERFEALEAIRRSESRMRGIFYWSSIGITMLNLDRQIVQNNPAFSKMIGFSDEQLCAMDMADDFSHPMHVVKIRDIFRQLVSRKYPVAQVESRFQRKDGQWIWVELTFSLFSENGSNPQFVICLVQDISDKKKTQLALERSEIQLRDLSRQLIDIQENEQRRLSFELHDSIGGNLAGIRYMLEKLKVLAEGSGEAFIDILKQTEAHVLETMAEVQRLSANLYPPMIEELGLKAALQWLCRKHNEIYTDMPAKLEAHIEEHRIPPELKMVIFRLTQEAMNNAAKHSRGNQIRVSLDDSGNRVDLSIIDNGTGFCSKPMRDLQDPRGLGLRSMIKRTELSGGHLEIKPKKGRGTRVLAKWPI